MEETPVLISGGGLVGLSAAMFLAQHGVAALVVEKLKSPSPLPRAAFFHMRTLELFREAGIEPAVRAQSEREFAPDGAVVAVESLAGRQIASFIPTLNEGVEEVSPCRRLFVSQPGLEPILRQRAEEGGARILGGHELVSAKQDSENVVAVVRDIETGRECQIRAQYLICAEGGRGSLRDQLGIAMDGHGVFSNSITIYFKADLSRHVVGRDMSVIYVINPVLSGFFRFEKDGKRGFLAINVLGDPVANPEAAANAGADTSEARLIELVRAATGFPDLEVEVEGVMRWRCTADIAQKYQVGRIFLAGDAVHLMPPTGGFGGNTGVHDAHNLAWKLALVLKGIAGRALLDTYDTERRPVGHFTVEQAYARYVTRTAQYLRATDYQPIAHDFDIELGYLYNSPAVLIELGSPEGHEDPRQSLGRPGSRAPHLWLERNGPRISTIDLFGGGFVLLAGREENGWVLAALEASAALPELPVEVHAVGSDGLADPSGQFETAFGIRAEGASLVRPDGFVAWRTSAAAGENAAAQLRSVLDRVLLRSR
jgi:2-polyprenyl-6-methoxyphenol hydroxylase-like FAD-dependent oxidoreductase